MTQVHPAYSYKCKRYSLFRLLLSVVLCTLLNACATPVSKLNELAREKDFTRTTMQVGGFELLVYGNHDSLTARNAPAATSVLHIYLEGDGSPWRHRTIIMPDPTPRSPLMLQLMAMDPQPAAYLGRPCYNGTSQEPPCEFSLWTSGRYSSRVIDSMASGVRVLARRHNAKEIWLFGHSGGGALAMLLAQQVPAVSRVITVAGNLDIDAWTAHHGYTPLYSSRNPALQRDLSEQVWQWHLLGARDGVIPPQLVTPFIMRQSSASGILFAGYDHGCCWSKLWPRLLDALANDDPGLLSGDQFKFRAVAKDVSENL